jgi:hypothetical protein
VGLFSRMFFFSRDEAAHATQGVPGGTARLIIPETRERSSGKKAYAVFYGRVPGVYERW